VIDEAEQWLFPPRDSSAVIDYPFVFMPADPVESEQ